MGEACTRGERAGDAIMRRANRTVLILCLTAIAAYSAAGVGDRAELAVFRVETDTAEGAGYLVDERGLVVTARALVVEARYIAIQVGAEEKYPARLHEVDEDSGIAVLRVHPNAVAGRPVIPWAGEETSAAPLVPGGAVLLVQTPATGAATLFGGFIRRVDATTIDTTVRAPASAVGGPLLDTQGDVVGVVTSIEDLGDDGAETVATRGPAMTAAIESARASLSETEPPPQHLLPCTSTRPYPAEALHSAVSAWPQAGAYVVQAGKFDVRVVTPALAQSVEAHGSDAVAWTALRRWRAYATEREPVVLIFAEPEPRRARAKGSSKYMRTDEVDDDAARGAFKACFRSMRLLRDGVPVMPIVPGRDCSWHGGADEAADADRDAGDDAGCAGVYRYRPEEFDPASEYTLEILCEENPDKPISVRLDVDLVRRVHDDFVPYFDPLATQTER